MNPDIRIALGLPHCPWDPHRTKSFARLRGQLGITANSDTCEHAHDVAVFADVGPQPNWVWSGKLWDWAAGLPSEGPAAPTHLLQVQDDVVVAPAFWGILNAMLTAVPDQIISLFTIYPHAQQLSQMGARWMTTTDWMTGPAYVMPMADLRAFHVWRAALRPGAIQAVNEDTLLGLFCAATGRRVWNPLPAPVDHDASLPSNYGNDHAGNNRASYTWRQWSPSDLHSMERPEFWVPTNPVPGSSGIAPHFGRAYPFTPASFCRWVPEGADHGGMTWDQRIVQIERDIVRTEVTPR